MACKNAFYDFLSNCNTDIKVNALLLPATAYAWIIIDKFDKQYSGEIITDGDGFFTIAVADLPAGLLNEFAGSFKMELFEDACKKVDFKMAQFYDSIEFNVKAGTRVKDNLGCDFSCDTTGGSGNSAVFPFTSAATINIPWTAFLKQLYGETPTVQVYHQTSPGIFQLVNVAVTMVGGPYDLTEIDIDNGGTATGYVLVN